jgi:hypothetical protein
MEFTDHITGEILEDLSNKNPTRIHANTLLLYSPNKAENNTKTVKSDIVECASTLSKKFESSLFAENVAPKFNGNGIIINENKMNKKNERPDSTPMNSPVAMIQSFGGENPKGIQVKTRRKTDAEWYQSKGLVYANNFDAELQVASLIHKMKDFKTSI